MIEPRRHLNPSAYADGTDFITEATSRHNSQNAMKNNSRVLIFFLLVAAIAGACRKQEANRSQANNSTPAATEAPAGGEAQRGDKFLFRGNIANLSIEMS